MFTFIATVVGWIVIFSISIINATRTEAKDCLKEYHLIVKEALEEIFEFWTTLDNKNIDEKSYIWRHKEQLLLMKLRNIRVELKEHYDFDFEDGDTFIEFLEIIGISYNEASLKKLVNGFFFDDEKANRLSQATILSEKLYKNSKVAYYKTHPKISFNRPRTVNILALVLVIAPLPIVFFSFFYFQVIALVGL
ncbi:MULTISPECIES: hypothetical protein [unclassified Pseudoalteromonas]|uniref:hypothetical protein n=1 Tax=unclassified Pseudoalteromonas TaxID=194690 RepID=UPI00110B28C2|nr:MULTISPECIES: hypothetical protein [unclassified Pseudoalteromonas]TMP49495.1 hypothetical protein CWB80_00175 [Pseudoalteromonas sp. S1650]TMP64548.1 hypothetical protein CWB79_20235 [Pseudoalteromonas sp. S1649]